MEPNDQSRTQAENETAAAGEGRWEQGSGQVAPGGAQEPAGTAEQDALGRDPAETVGHQRNAAGELITEGVQPDEKGHGDAETEQRVDQVTGPGGVQRERENLAVYDPGRVGLEPGDDRNPSDPTTGYPSPDDQRQGTSREQ